MSARLSDHDATESQGELSGNDPATLADFAVMRAQMASQATRDILNSVLDTPKRSRGRPRKYPKVNQQTPTLTVQDLSVQKEPAHPFSPSRGINAGFRAASPDKRKNPAKGDTFDPCADIEPGSFMLANGKLYSESKMSAYIPALLEDRSRKMGDVIPIRKNDQVALISLTSPSNPIWATEGDHQLQNVPVAGFVRLRQHTEANHNSFSPSPLIPSPNIDVDVADKHRWERLKSLVDPENVNLALASSLVLVPEFGRAELRRGGQPDYDFPTHYRPLRRGYKPEETRYVIDPLFELEIERTRRAKWTDEERTRFEAALDKYGKEFFRVWQVVQGIRASDLNAAWADLKLVSERVYQECGLTRYADRFGPNEPWFDRSLLTGPYLGVAGAVSPLPPRTLMNSKTVADCVQYYYLHKHSLETQKRKADEKRFAKELDAYKSEATKGLESIKSLIAQARSAVAREETARRLQENAALEKLGSPASARNTASASNNQ